MIIRMRNWSNVLEVKDICDVNKTWTFYLNPLLGTPVSANHVAASECVKSYRYRSRAWVNVHIKHQNKEQVWSLTEAWLLVPDQSASSLILSSTRRFHQQNCRSLNVFLFFVPLDVNSTDGCVKIPGDFWNTQTHSSGTSNQTSVTF